MKKKFIFLGDLNSINIELIDKSHKYLKKSVKYILIGNSNELFKYLKKISSNLNINEINNPLNFDNYIINSLNIYNVDNISKKKYLNLINQIKIANYLANLTKIDLVTLPINKSLFKKNLTFIGMTEYLGSINNKKTIMLMHGKNFSTIPLTTHINLNDVRKIIKKHFLKEKINKILSEIERKIYKLKFKKIVFLCFNPHCGENKTLGLEDNIIYESIKKIKKIFGPISADSAFKNPTNKLYISLYHDQALIPFKILNKQGVNLTLGLNYRRLSPIHGTASDIKFKNLADNSSYISCMKF